MAEKDMPAMTTQRSNLVSVVLVSFFVIGRVSKNCSSFFDRCCCSAAACRKQVTCVFGV
jgi:hypothetical protein